MQNWKKAGLIYECRHASALPYYAGIPFVKQVNRNIFRIYYNGRDNNNTSFVSFIDYNINLREVIADEGLILLKAGNPGCFDDAGTVLSQIVTTGNVDRLYYSGWTLGAKVPFRINIGVAESESGTDDFKKYSEGPVVGQTIFDPYMAGSPFIIIENGIWKMWYVSCIRWEFINGSPRHFYHIKYTESIDGINWTGERITAIDFKNEYEYAIARPVVIRENGIYKMWYSYRAGSFFDTYRIGYAESDNGLKWIRMDQEVMLGVSENGWDSEMVCYPFIFDHEGKRYMLYNGNGYGRTGFGLAVLEQD